MAGFRISIHVGTDGVAIITLVNPPVNSLAIPIIDELKEVYDEAMKRDDVKAIVLTGGGGMFCGGADINSFAKTQTSGNLSLLPDMSIRLMTNFIEEGKKPSVAAIQGLALGGGLELAMGCHARISTPKAQLGFPELSLGIVPGTQRLPRLVGLKKGVEMLLSSEIITSEEGHKLGLIDAVVSPQELLTASRLWALEIAGKRKPLVQTLHKTDKIGSRSEACQFLTEVKEQAKQTARNMPQHQAGLETLYAVEEGIVHGTYAGTLKESQVFKEMVVSDTSKGLMHVFLARRLTSKIQDVTNVGLKPRHAAKVAVVGGDLMGSGIATALLLDNIYVILKEVNSVLLSKGIKSVEGNIRALVVKRKLVQEKADKALSLLKGVIDYSEFKDVDMVIEAVNENVPLKQQIHSDLEKFCPPHCILATNTSTIDINTVGEKTSSQDRIVGAHFFSPAHIMPLLEIVRTNKTSAQVILDLLTFAKTIKKLPVVVGNCTGFAVNRTFFPYSQSACLLVNLGVDLFRIDRVITNFGMPVGPFQLQDLAGYGVVLATGKEFDSAFPDRTFKSPLAELLIENGRKGKTNGKGFYIYEKGAKPKPDFSVLPIIEECRRLTNIMPGGEPISISDQEILEMIFFPVVNEACRVLDEGIVVRASDLDVASVQGMSFPSYRGGIVFWADTVCASHIHTSLKKWANLHGDFFKPSRYLEERVAKGLLLSAPGSTSSSSLSRL